MEALKELYCSEIKYNGLNNMKRMQLYNLKRNWSIKKKNIKCNIEIKRHPEHPVPVPGKNNVCKWKRRKSKMEIFDFERMLYADGI